MDKVKALIERGVKVLYPIEIGDEVDISRIEAGVIIHSGCRIYGKDTLIKKGTELGLEAPVTISNCQIGREVNLKGGVFYESTLLDKVSIGSGAQIREACLLEEEVRCAHCVGLKQTILFPYVTLGSLINFCDCLMAGGTDRKNHSEVGSSYIHFNYTPNQDKATASLIGDVPRGVMLREPPIFLGGQGGIIGPVRIGYGVVVAAGTIIRKDLLEENTLFIDYPARVSKKMPFHKGLYNNPKRIFRLNIIYISNLIALKIWYENIRSIFLDRNLLKGAISKIHMGIKERIKRLKEVAEKMPYSVELYKKIKGHEDGIVEWKMRFYNRWPRIEEYIIKAMDYEGDKRKKERFLAYIEAGIKRIGEKDYIKVIKGLSQKESSVGTSWLKTIVDNIVKNAEEILR